MCQRCGTPFTYVMTEEEQQSVHQEAVSGVGGGSASNAHNQPSASSGTLHLQTQQEVIMAVPTASALMEWGRAEVVFKPHLCHHAAREVVCAIASSSSS